MRTILFSIFVALSLSGPFAAYADTPTLIPETGVIPECDFRSGQIHANCVPAYLAWVIYVIFSLTGMICLMNIFYAGYQIMMGKAAGTDSSAGKERLQWAIIGLAICVLSIAIIDLVLSTLI